MIELNKVYVGKISEFGGSWDSGVSSSEGLALYERYEDRPDLFLDYQPLKMPHEAPGRTTGLARRLNPNKYYCAMRWDYSITPKEMLRNCLVQITYKNRMVIAPPVDWGPNPDTKRIIDASKKVLVDLCCPTDAEVECKLFQGVMT
jgi:hypothetical protein